MKAIDQNRIDAELLAAVKAAERRPYFLQARHAVVLPYLAATVALLVLVGWSLHHDGLKRMGLGLTTMNPMTAVGILMACSSLGLLYRGRPRLRTPPGLLLVLLSVGLLATGASRLVDIVAGSRLCPDSRLFASQLGAGPGQPYQSRIAPNVAVCFVLLGAALLATDRPRWPRWLHPQAIGLFVFLMALLAMVGYAYDTVGFYRYKQYVPMAPHTAFCLALIATGLVLLRPGQGFLMALPRGSEGARSFGLLLPAAVVLPVVLGVVGRWAAERGLKGGTGSGAALATILTVAALVVLTYRHATSLSRVEAVRRLADANMRDYLADLDAKNQQLQREIAERQRAEEAATHQAMHDPLTGLPNRLLFLDRLQKSIGRTVRGGTACALCYIDIDDFKPINDRFGHAAGDVVLREIARRLEATVREVDTVARLGGDEFAAIMDAPVNAQHSREFAERLVAAIAAPYRLDLAGGLREVRVGASVGVALFPGHASDVDSLVRAADMAMYRAKTDAKRVGRAATIEFAEANDVATAGAAQDLRA